MPTTLVISVCSVLGFAALISFLGVVYIAVNLTYQGAYKDPSLLHIMVIIYYSVVLSLVYPTITLVLIMGEGNLNPILCWSMLTIQRIFLIQYPMISCMSFIWDTLSFYYPLKCLYWKSTRKREVIYFIGFVVSTLAVIARCLQFGLTEGSHTDSVDGIFFPTHLDGTILLFTQCYIMTITFVSSQYLILKMAKNNVLKIIKHKGTQQDHVGRDKINNHKKISKQVIVFGIGSSVMWTVFCVFFHFKVFCKECIPDKLLTFTILCCFISEMVCLPIMIGANVKVATILKSAFKRDRIKVECCRKNTVELEESQL